MSLQFELTGNAVLSVAGKKGTVTLVEGDITNLTTDLAAKAPLASPALTGTPTAPTPAAGDNSTTVATTAYVDQRFLATSMPASDSLNSNGGTQSFTTKYTFAANKLANGKLFRVFIGWKLVGSGTPPTTALKVLLGGSAIFSVIAVQAPAATTTYGGLELYLAATAAPAASVTVITHPVHPAGANSSALSPLSGNSAVPPSLATNGTLDLTVQYVTGSTVASNSMALTMLVVEALN